MSEEDEGQERKDEVKNGINDMTVEEKDDEKVETKAEETKYRFGVSRSEVNARIAEPVVTRTHRSFSLYDNYPKTPIAIPPTFDSEASRGFTPDASRSEERVKTEKAKKKRRGQPRVRPPQKVRAQLRCEREAAAVDAKGRSAQNSFPASSSKG